MSELYPYQREAVDKLHELRGRAGLFMEMGTGKTRVTLIYLQEAKAERVLICLPISAASVWRREIRKLGLRWHGLNLTKRGIHERERALRQHGGSTQVVLVNYDVFWMPKQADLKHRNTGVRNRARAQSRLVNRIKAWAPDSVVLDEVHRIKGRRSRQSMFAASIVRWPTVRRRLGLTGTPITQGIEDLFGIYRFIDPAVFGTQWLGFAGHYLKMGGYFARQIVGYFNKREARQKVERTSYIISKRKALGLPSRKTVVLDIPFTPASRKRYDKFTKDAIAELDGVDADGNKLKGNALARVVLTQLIRQQQLASGFANTDKGTIYVSNEKLLIAQDLVNDALANGQQVVIFCLFLPDVRRLNEKIKGSLTYTGKNKSTREANRRKFQRGECKVLIVQAAAGSESIDLTAASIGIFYSYSYRLLHYAQARDRLHRHGQKHKVTYYVLQVKRSADVKVFRALSKKQDIARSIGRLDYAKRLLSS